MFYVWEGLLKPDYSRRGADKWGIGYLQKAETYQSSHLTQAALGKAFFTLADYAQAAKHFEKACTIKDEYASACNFALTLYRQKKYAEAAKWFEKAVDMSDAANQAETCAAYLFSLLQTDKRKCQAALHNILKLDAAFMEMDKFLLSYFCKDWPAAESQIEMIINSWSLDVTEMAVVLDYLLISKQEQRAADLVNQRMAELKEYDYDVRTAMNQINKAFAQADYRKGLISSFQYIRPLVSQCCYYGCKIHNI